MSHLTEENRKTISNMLTHKATCKEIAERIGCDPTTISKEIKKNRVISKEAKGNKKILCKKLDRYPYVCLDCPKKYTTCTITQLRYIVDVAQKKYEYRLHESRKGINLTKEELIWNGGTSSLVELCERLLNMQKEGEVAHLSLRDYLQRHPECRYPVDWKMAALSGERNVHSSAFLHLEDYSYHRAIALAITKEAEECAKEAIYLIKLGNSLSREPSDISLLLKQKLIDSGLKVIYLGLNLGLWEEFQLSELQKELEKVDFWDDYRLGMMGERATINEYALNVGVKTYAFLKDVNISTIQEKDVLKYFPENWLERLKLHLRPKGWFFRDLLEYNYMMDTLIEIQDREDRKFNSLETPFALQNLEDYLMEWKNKSFRTKNLICNDKLASFYWKIIIELPWRQFDIDATAASCAVERYYIREGRYPKSISDLQEICPLIDNNDRVNFIPLNIEFTEDEYCFINPGWTRVPVGKEMESKALGIWRWKMQKKGVFADER